MELNGTSAVVSGGASGLGEATARALAAAGATVVIADLNENRGKQVADDIGGLFARTDVADETSVQAAVDAAASTGSPLRVAVSCAGIGWAARTVARDGTPHDLASYQKVIAVNLIGTFNLMRIAAAAMAKTEPADADGQRGVIINTSSIAGIEGQTGQIAYSASKGGIIGMTVPAARDLSAIGVRVNTICPGIIDTPIYGFTENAAEFKARLAAPVVFPKRMGRPEEFGHLVRALIENDYMNAEVVRFDGGIRFQPKSTGNVRPGPGARSAAVLAGRGTGQLQEDVVQRGPAQPDVADADLCLAQLRGRLLHQLEPVARGRKGEPVRALVRLRLAAAHPGEHRLRPVTLPRAGQFHLQDLAADAVLELVPGSRGTSAIGPRGSRWWSCQGTERSMLLPGAEAAAPRTVSSAARSACWPRPASCCVSALASTSSWAMSRSRRLQTINTLS